MPAESARSICARSSRSISVASPLATMDGTVIGTPHYMPPEQAAGKLDAVGERSDVYAIGALLYQLLTGEAPYVKSGARMSPYAVLAAVSMGPPRSVHEIDASAPEELQAICEKAMARNRAKRYATAEELAEELGRFLRGEPVHARPLGWWRRFRRRRARGEPRAVAVAPEVAEQRADRWCDVHGPRAAAGSDLQLLREIEERGGEQHRDALPVSLGVELDPVARLDLGHQPLPSCPRSARTI